MTNPIEERQRELVEELNLLPTWEDRYEYIIEFGKRLAPLPEQYRTEHYLVKGCLSKVWLGSECREGRVTYYADSDALLVKGLVAMLMHIFSGQTVEDILNARIFWVEEIGLNRFLSMTRANGLMAMIRQIRREAQSYKVHCHG